MVQLKMRTNTHRRTATHLLLAASATAVALEPLLTIAQGSHTPAWAHWLCSPALRSAVHTVGGRGLGTTLLTALEVHWPHFLPILLGLATLVYLYRANMRYHAQDDAPTSTAATTSHTTGGGVPSTLAASAGSHSQTAHA
jgi:hypothetical protein